MRKADEKLEKKISKLNEKAKNVTLEVEETAKEQVADALNLFEDKLTAQHDIDSKDHQKIVSSNDDKLKVLDAKITVIDDKVSKTKAAGASDPKTGILKCPNGSIVFSLCEYPHIANSMYFEKKEIIAGN